VAVRPVENTRRIPASAGTDAVGAGMFATSPVAASRQPASGIRRRKAKRIRVEKRLADGVGFDGGTNILGTRHSTT
jgi:hypothetical protein